MSSTAALPSPDIIVTPTNFTLVPKQATDVNLELTNPNPMFPLIFKMKTTTPQKFIVRNRQGVIAGGCSSVIHITLQHGVVAESPAGTEEQFLVEYRFITEEENSSVVVDKLDVSNLLRMTTVPKGKRRLLCRIQSADSSILREPPPVTNGPATAQANPNPAAAVAPPQQPVRNTEQRQAFASTTPSRVVPQTVGPRTPAPRYNARLVAVLVALVALTAYRLMPHSGGAGEQPLPSPNALDNHKTFENGGD